MSEQPIDPRYWRETWANGIEPIKHPTEINPNSPDWLDGFETASAEGCYNERQERDQALALLTETLEWLDARAEALDRPVTPTLVNHTYGAKTAYREVASQIREGLRKHGLSERPQGATASAGRPDDPGYEPLAEPEPGKRRTCTAPWRYGSLRACTDPNCPIHGTPTEER